VRTKTVQDPGASYRELKSRESVWVKSGPDKVEGERSALAGHVGTAGALPGRRTSKA